MRRPVLLLLLIAILLCSCQASEDAQMQETTVRPEFSSVIPSASPKPTATPEAIATPIAPTPTSELVYRTPTPHNDEIDAPDSSTIPVGVAYPGFLPDGNYDRMRMYGLDILGGYTEDAFYEWYQYRFGNPPLRAADFFEKYGLGDDDHENDKKVTDASSVLIKSGLEFFLYGADGSKYRGMTKGGLVFGWDEVSSIGFDYRLDKKKVPLGYYIAVFGKWDAVPRKPKIIDENGSMEVDLDGDGTDDFIRVCGDRYSYVQFMVEIDGDSYELVTYKVDADEYGLFKYGKEKQPDHYAFAYPIDVNGDGMMEVATFGLSSLNEQAGFIFSVSKDEVKEITQWYNN